MRTIGLAILALSATLVVFGCGPNPSSSSSISDSNAKVSSAKQKIGEAADATADAAKAKRDEYAREMSKQLDEFDKKCKDLEVRIIKAEGQAKKDLEKKYEEAKVKRDAAGKKLEELKVAGADRWEKVKEGVGNALDDLKKVFD